MLQKNLRLYFLTIGIVFLTTQVLFTIFSYPYLPAFLEVHFNLSGIADGSMSKLQASLIFLSLSAFWFTIFLIIVNSNKTKSSFYWGVGLLIVLVIVHLGIIGHNL